MDPNIQNLKAITPKIRTSHDKQKIPRIYASEDEAYASAFTFNWDDIIAKFGRYNSGLWTLEIEKKYKSRMLKPCSLYIVEKTNFKSIEPPEYTINKPVKVIREVEFKSSLDCMLKCGVKIIWK